MQFVDGTDADAALRAEMMAPQRAVHIIAEVAKALDFAHAHNVVHRDVKPANFPQQLRRVGGGVEGVEYPTAELAQVAAKTLDPQIRASVLQIDMPGNPKRAIGAFNAADDEIEKPASSERGMQKARSKRR